MFLSLTIDLQSYNIPPYLLSQTFSVHRVTNIEKPQRNTRTEYATPCLFSFFSPSFPSSCLFFFSLSEDVPCQSSPTLCACRCTRWLTYCSYVVHVLNSQLQIGWHSISRLFLKLFQRTRILPMGFTISTKKYMMNPMRILVRLVLNWKFLELISRCCATLSAIGCITKGGCF